MSDSQRPNPPTPRFEVPDLELEPVPRAPPRAAPARPVAKPSAHVKAPSPTQAQSFGASIDLGDDFEDDEFERSAQPKFHLAGESARAGPAQPAAEPGPAWPKGRALDTAELQFDPRELAILADYGDPPSSAPETLAYAYRVFTRQRELKRQLVPISAECERAHFEREATLAELARAVRPACESLPEFRRFLLVLAEIEQRATAHGQALESINAQLDAEGAELDAELARNKSQLESERQLVSEAQRQHDEREANAKRADAKLKRLQIEIRAVLNVAEQKLGPRGGQIPDPEAAQLATLRQRAEAMQPEVAQARAEFEHAKQVRSRLYARHEALAENQRQIARKKQGLGAGHQKQLSARSQGVSESEIEQRAALAELARALLAARGTVPISEPWLERVRSVSDRADQLSLRAEMQRRAIAGYDGKRARQGVRLACTALGLLLVLFTFKLIF